MNQIITWKVNQFGEQYSPEINGQLFEAMPSESVFARFLPEGFIQKNILGIVIGTDSGLILNYLKYKAKKNNSIYICIDKLEVVTHLKELGWQDTEHVKLFDDNFQLKYLLSIDEYKYRKYVVEKRVFLLSSIAPVDKKLDYNELLGEYKQQFNFLSMFVATEKNSKLFIDSTLRNFPDMLHHVGIIKNKYHGRTAVLLGGGPSVGIAFEWIKQNREQLVIFAATRLAGRLKQEDIYPDFFCAVDPQLELLDYAKEIFDFVNDSILLCTSTVAHNIVSQWAGRIIYSDQLPHFSEDDDIHAGPTVMNYALELAVYLGFEHIVLSGVDLCYNKEGHSHESNSLEAKVARFIRVSAAQLETYEGGLANTDTSMASARDAMQIQVNLFKEKNSSLKFYQINSRAAKIKHVELIDLLEIPLPINSSRLITLDIVNVTAWNSDLVDNVLKERINKIKSKISLYRKVQRTVKNILIDVRKINAMRDHILNRVINSVNKVIADVEKKLGNELIFLFKYSGFDYNAEIKTLSGSKTLYDFQKNTSEYFTMIYDSLNNYSHALSNSLLSLDLRLREAHGELDLSIFDSWLERNEPGRGLVWLVHNKHLSLSHEQTEWLNLATEKFEKLILNGFISHRETYADENFRFGSFWNQVKVAFEREDVEQLSVLSEYLLENFSDNDLLSLGNYAKICLFSLQKEWSDVIQYAEYIKNDNLLIPTLRLKLKACLTMDQTQMAFDTLNVLIQYEPDYMLQYASIALILGHLELAQEAVQTYVLNNQANEFVVRQVWQWAMQNKQVLLQEWLRELIENILPDLLLIDNR